MLLIAKFIALMSLNPEPGLPRTPAPITATVGTPYYLPAVAVLGVPAHLFLTTAERTRERWDSVLEFLGSRPKDLETQ